MFKKLWKLLAPFHRTFLKFVLIATLYEGIQIASSYSISLVVTLFGMGINLQSWVYLLIGLLILDEINMLVDNWFDWHIIMYISHRIFMYLGIASTSKFFKMDIPWHHRQNSGTLVGKVNDGTWKALAIIETASWELIPTIVKVLLSLIPLIIITPLAALIAVITFVIFAWMSIMGNKEKRPIQSDRQNKYEELWKEFVSGVQTVETGLMNGQQDRLLKKQIELHEGIIADAAKEHRIGIYKYNRWRIRLLTISKRIILMVWISQLMTGTITIPSLIYVNSLIEQLYSSFWRFARVLDRAAESSEGAERLVNLLYEVEPVETGVIQNVPDGPLGISLKDVSFSYEGSDKNALHDFNLEVEPGTVVALVGPSGAGKSTVEQIITRFLLPQKGLVTVGGICNKNWEFKQLLAQIGYVPQGGGVHIFDKTLGANLLDSRPDATLEEMVCASKYAGLHPFITTLPLGYETQVGENGIRLSEGQKQRVALARAILKNAKILILDEATSSVDSITENEIQEHMSKYFAGKTVIIIAHRLSTVRNADKIVVMDNGRKVEEGTHGELISKKGLYAKMVALQTG